MPIANAALQGSGLSGQRFRAPFMEQCARLKGEVDVYPGAYACGFKRYVESGQDVVRVWSAMINLTEASGRTFDPAMFDTAVAQLRAGSR